MPLRPSFALLIRRAGPGVRVAERCPPPVRRAKTPECRGRALRGADVTALARESAAGQRSALPVRRAGALFAAALEGRGGQVTAKSI